MDKEEWAVPYVPTNHVLVSSLSMVCYFKPWVV
jgi:hypothetical protein